MHICESLHSKYLLFLNGLIVTSIPMLGLSSLGKGERGRKEEKKVMSKESVKCLNLRYVG